MSQALGAWAVVEAGCGAAATAAVELATSAVEAARAVNIFDTERMAVTPPDLGLSGIYSHFRQNSIRKKTPVVRSSVP
jgi:hypothetical protein